METMTARDAELRFRPAPTAPRRALGATLVAALYGLLVLSAPLLIRYGPDPEVQAAAMATQLSTSIRCATAPEFGLSCTRKTVDPAAANLVVATVPH